VYPPRGEHEDDDADDNGVHDEDEGVDDVRVVEARGGGAGLGGGGGGGGGVGGAGLLTHAAWAPRLQSQNF
jgi:hypothetical protein